MVSEQRAERNARDEAIQARNGGTAWTVVVVLLPTLAFILHAVALGAWLVDDALITFAYARSIEEGHGYVAQSGAAPVEGLSNPLWAVLLASLRAVGLFDVGGAFAGVPDYVVTTKLLATAFFLATVICFHVAASSVWSRPAARVGTLAGGLFLAVSTPYLVWAVSGLENALYGCLVAGLAALLVRSVHCRSLASVRVASIAGVLSLLLATTRPDGVLFFAAHPLLLLVFRDHYSLRGILRAALVGLGCFGVPSGALLLWRHVTFAVWVPNTAVAKGQGGLRLDAVLRVLELPDALGIAMAISLGAVLAGYVAFSSRRRMEEPQAPRFLRASAGVVAPLGLSAVAYLVLRQDWMPEYRFATPFVVLSCALLALLVAAIADDLPAGWMPRAVGLIAIGVLLAAQVIQMAKRTDEFRAAPTISGCTVVERYGHAFNNYADRLGLGDASVMLPDVGGVLMTSRLKVVDYAGLVDEHIAPLRGAGDLDALHDHVLVERRPTFVGVHDGWDDGLTDDGRFSAEYLEIVPGQDFVRRDAVGDPAVLESLRSDAQDLVDAWAERNSEDPLRDCGVLNIGDVRVQTGGE